VARLAASSVVGAGRGEDAAQEALLRAWRHAGSCRSPERPQPWLREISRREALRSASASARTTAATREPEAVQEGPDPQAVALRQAIAQLPPLDRTLIVRFYWKGERDHEIADALGLPLGTVKIRLHRARRRLGRDLGADFVDGASSGAR
jgi:RNA polymerase sigma-70 factor (ECF subfamily)